MQDTYNIIDSATAVTILKWAVTILIAGFIAQFGKKFAVFLIEKTRSIRKEKTAAGNDSEGAGEKNAPVTMQDNVRSSAERMFAAEKARLKLEKKKSKNSNKKRKK